MTSLVEAAAFLCSQWPVFPCRPDKKPATAHGFKDATQDEAAVRRMFSQPGAALIGVPTGPASGLFVVDVDVRHGGEAWLIANEMRLPRTRTHRTMSGGWHLLFAWPADRQPRNSASKIAPGVDTRGAGGYVVMPPSQGYAIEDDAMPAEAPRWLLDLIDPPAPPPAPREPYKAPQLDGDGTPFGRSALRSACEAIAHASDGAKHDTLNREAYSMGGLVSGGHLLESAARAELRDALRAILPRCDDPRAAERTLEQAFRDGMAAPRQVPERAVPSGPAQRVAPSAPVPGSGQPMQAEAPPKPGEVQPLPTLTLDEIEALPPPSWLIEGLLVECSNASLIAPPKSLKSFLALDWALHLAYGIPWQGRPVKQCGVIYIAGEGVGGMARRIAAWRAFHGCSGNNAPFRLVAVPFRILNAAHVASAAATAKFMLEADGHQVGLYVNDTLARSMAGADENSAQDMGRAVEGMDHIKHETGATMLSVHHTGKDADRGARGSSALLGAVDTEITVKRSESLLTIKVTAQKDAEEGDEIHVRAQKVGLNGRDPVEGQPSSLVLLKAENTPITAGPVLSDGAKFGLSALHETLIREGVLSRPGTVPEVVPLDVKWVSKEAWRAEFYARSHLENDESKKRAFNRAINDLRDKAVIGFHSDIVWLCNAR